MNKQELEALFNEQIAKVTSIQDINNLKAEFIGKDGYVTQMLYNLKNLTIEEKKIVGKEVNELKEKVNAEITSKYDEISINKNLEKYDITLDVADEEMGSLHPITIVEREVTEILKTMGFLVVTGPEVDDDYHNFEALNFMANHPARDMHDTYWLSNGQLPRTHTSTCQVRALEQYGAPLRIIAPGRCFRNEDIDACHDTTFFQLEGMYVDRDVSIKNMIYVMKTILSKVFEREVKVRLRPGYFPFVEPCFELDINCLICGGVGCPTCKHTGWSELLPCGMVHPNVLEFAGVNSEEYKGFAFGMGLTRLAMMKYGISDIRLMNSGDLRVLKQMGVR